MSTSSGRMPELRRKVGDDEKSKDFIRALEYYGGEATTTDIRRRTGLSRSETQTRFNKLEELGLIDITRAESGYGDREPPKIASLTGVARAAIERGLLGTGEFVENESEVIELSEEEYYEMQETIERLQKRVDVLTYGGGSSERAGAVDAEVAERIEELERRVQDVADRSRSGGEVSTEGVRRIERRVAEVEESVTDLEDYVFEWTGTAETYLLALRRVLEEKLDVSMGSYLKQVEESSSENEL